MSEIDIKDFPTPGYQYKLKKRDSRQGLSGVARKAYGNGREWRIIWRANKSNARTNDPNRGFWIGDIIFIPGNPVIVEKKAEPEIADMVFGVGRNTFTLYVEDIEIPVMSGRLLRSIDSLANGWTARAVWNPEDEERARLFRPYSYARSSVYLGGELSASGILYGVSPNFSSQGSVIELQGWSKAADAIDSHIKPPFEANRVSLEERARGLLEPLELSMEFNVDEDKKFKRVKAGKTETIFTHLARLAKQRGVLITTTPKGKVLFTRAETPAPIGTILEGAPPYMEASVKFDGRRRFGSYTATGQSPRKSSKTATAVDSEVPRSRFMRFSADESETGELENAANWQRSKQLSDAFSLSLPVNSWYGPDNKLWTINTVVTLVSARLFLPKGYNFLIRSVEFIFEATGATAVLGLVPPSVYTGDELENPWAEVS